MNRKKFLTISALTAFSLSTFGNTVKKLNTFVGDCETTNDILGPFYRPNAPTRNDLTFENLKGNIIEIEGHIFENDCSTPSRNTLIEIWHCDSNGNYDNNSKAFLHRAKSFTDDNGFYKFKTIIPGKYLNGNKFRPSHIHFRVTNKDKKELISQIYFKGDTKIELDPWASKETAEKRILPLIPYNNHGGLSVIFDIYL
jgi:protocatechuate 3,4-dioxygenase beta subunit